MGVMTLLVCDTCGAKLELDGPYFNAKAAMKEAGWINEKAGDSWRIRCKGCRK